MKTSLRLSSQSVCTTRGPVFGIVVWFFVLDNKSFVNDIFIHTTLLIYVYINHQIYVNTNHVCKFYDFRINLLFKDLLLIDFLNKFTSEIFIEKKNEVGRLLHKVLRILTRHIKWNKTFGIAVRGLNIVSVLNKSLKFLLFHVKYHFNRITTVTNDFQRKILIRWYFVFLFMNQVTLERAYCVRSLFFQ